MPLNVLARITCYHYFLPSEFAGIHAENDHTANLPACEHSECVTSAIHNFGLLRVQVILKTGKTSFSDNINCGSPPTPPNAVQVGVVNKYTASYKCVPGYQFKSGETVDTISCNKNEWTPMRDICEGSLFLPTFLPHSLLCDKRYGALAEHLIYLQQSIKLHQ